MKNIKLLSVSSFEVTENNIKKPIIFKMGDSVTVNIEVTMYPSLSGAIEINQFNKENGTTQEIKISSSLIYSYYDTSQKQRFYFTIQEFISNSLDELLNEDKEFLVSNDFNIDSKRLPDFKKDNTYNNLSYFFYVINMNIENKIVDEILKVEVPILRK